MTQPRDLALLAATAAHPGFQATVTLLVYPALARLAAAGRTDRLVGRVLLVDRLCSDSHWSRSREPWRPVPDEPPGSVSAAQAVRGGVVGLRC